MTGDSRTNGYYKVRLSSGWVVARWFEGMGHRLTPGNIARNVYRIVTYLEVEL